MAYFSKLVSMKDMIGHIYGKNNVIQRDDRPNMFIKELNIYIEFLKDKVNDASRNPVEKEQKYLLSFSENLEQGIEYYSNLFKEKSDSFNESYELLMNNLEDSFQRLKLLKLRISNLMLFKMTKTENVKQSSHNGTKFKESIFTHKSNSLVN